MSGVQAWLIELHDGNRVAIGEFEMKHVIPDDVDLYAIPHSPFYCNNVLIWEGSVLPVMDVSAWMNGTATPRNESVFGIVAYRDPLWGETHHGVLQMAGMPRRVGVTDEQACELDDRRWSDIAIACFRETERAIPVLDLAHLFGGGLKAA